MRVVLWSLLALAAGCRVVPKPPAAAESEPTYHRREVTRIVAEARWIDTTRGIDELIPVTAGGITQWVSVRGRDRRNPILLYVHGGPGTPTMPAAWFFQTPWEDYFTVVQWDQRAAGKTAAANDAATVRPTISRDRMIADGEEVIQFLLARYGKRKLFLMGHSWGTIIGTTIAQRHPEWLHAYIGMGQVVDDVASERLSYRFALDAAKAAGHQEAIRALDSIAPYPEADGSIPVPKILIERRWVIYFGGLTWRRSDWSYEPNLAKLSPDYGVRDLEALDRGEPALLSQLFGKVPTNFRSMTTFRCPVFIVAGKYDFETASAVAREWYETIRAPAKGFFWFEHSAHMMPFEQPGKLFLHLVRDVRPVAEAAGDAPPVE